VDIRARVSQYMPFQLKTDLSQLTDSERRMLPLLMDAAQAMDEPFWIQNYGDRQALLASTRDVHLKRYIQLNYGPWDRLRLNEPFVPGFGEKPPGANFYPSNITQDEFDRRAAHTPDLKSPYTMVRRDEHENLTAVPYHSFFRTHVSTAVDKLRQAAELTEDPNLRDYLTLRADALLTDNYRSSDAAWVDLRANTLDILIGPMEVEDRLFGIKTAYAASVLVRDGDWTELLVKYTNLLGRFQEHLPVAEDYRRERPGLNSHIGVYDVVYYAGNDKASTPLGIAWPDDEEVQLSKGMRSLLLRNVMRGRFERNLRPIAELLINDAQYPYVTFEAYFLNIMLHEIAHGLGIKLTIADGMPVRQALKELHYALEEAKAEALSLVVVRQLYDWGYVSTRQVHEVYITALLRLLYNGDSHQSAILISHFRKNGAYSRDQDSGTWTVNVELVPEAANTLVERLLHLQGDADYDRARVFVEIHGQPDEDLQRDLERIEAAQFPLALAVEQDGDWLER